MPEPRRSFRTRVTGIPAALLIVLVRIYQRTLSPLLPVLLGPSCGCRFTPTCSHYAVEALRTRGACFGLWLAAVRLLKCTPLHPGGEDPVPAARPRPHCRATTRFASASPSPLP